MLLNVSASLLQVKYKISLDGLLGGLAPSANKSALSNSECSILSNLLYKLDDASSAEIADTMRSVIWRQNVTM